MHTMHDTSPLSRFSNYSRMLQFLQFVSQTSQSSAQESVPIIVNETIQQILTYINDNFSQPLRLDTIAHTFGMSISHLSHAFDHYTGRSVYDYILYRRIQFAKELIHMNLPLGEISSQCGFGDYSGFLRAFKKVTGMSPNKYRKICQLSTF